MYYEQFTINVLNIFNYKNNECKLLHKTSEKGQPYAEAAYQVQGTHR
jgi:hypothetical protein